MCQRHCQGRSACHDPIGSKHRAHVPRHAPSCAAVQALHASWQPASTECLHRRPMCSTVGICAQCRWPLRGAPAHGVAHLTTRLCSSDGMAARCATLATSCARCSQHPPSAAGTQWLACPCPTAKPAAHPGPASVPASASPLTLCRHLPPTAPLPIPPFYPRSYACSCCRVQDVRLERTELRGGVARVTGYADFDGPASAEGAMNLVKVHAHTQDPGIPFEEGTALDSPCCPTPAPAYSACSIQCSSSKRHEGPTELPPVSRPSW